MSGDQWPVDRPEMGRTPGQSPIHPGRRVEIQEEVSPSSVTTVSPEGGSEEGSDWLVPTLGFKFLWCRTHTSYTTNTQHPSRPRVRPVPQNFLTRNSTF